MLPINIRRSGLQEVRAWPRYALPVLYFVVTILLFVQAMATGRYNNYIIFRNSFYHLIHGQPLYTAYPAAYFDIFQYHPSFPVLFAPFSLLPEQAGLLCWLLFSTALFLYMLKQLPFDDGSKKVIGLFLLLEFGNAIQSSQTNPLLAILMVLTVVALQKQQPAKASLFAALCFFIKGYGAIVALAFLFFPRKGAFIGWGLFWGIVGSALPLCFISPALLLQHYTDWLRLLTSPVIKEDGSLLGMLHHAFRMDYSSALRFDKIALLLACTSLLYVLFRGIRSKNGMYPWLLLCYLMIWVVIFNQSTESPTYIIALTGVGIAGYAMPLPSRGRQALLWGAWILTSLAPTELVPHFINYYAITWGVKPLACFVTLLLIQAHVGVTTRSRVIPETSPL